MIGRRIAQSHNPSKIVRTFSLLAVNDQIFPLNIGGSKGTLGVISKREKRRGKVGWPLLLTNVVRDYCWWSGMLAVLWYAIFSASFYAWGTLIGENEGSAGL